MASMSFATRIGVLMNSSSCETGETVVIDMDVEDSNNDTKVVDGKKEGEEHTTVIGQFNSRTGEFLLNRTPRSYDLKGRSVRDASRKAKGMYLKK